MAVDSFDERGSGSVTVPGVAGKSHRVTSVHAYFQTTGPATGTLRLKENTTTVWEASVSGGLSVSFHPRWELAAGADATLELSGGSVRIVGLTV